MKSVGNTECLKSPCWRSCFKVITWTFGEKMGNKKTQSSDISTFLHIKLFQKLNICRFLCAFFLYIL